MATIVVERSFDEPVVFDEIQAQEDAWVWCYDENGVTFQHTYLSADRKRMVCIYEAPDAESVRRVSDRAKMPYDTIWTAEVKTNPEGPGE